MTHLQRALNGRTSYLNLIQRIIKRLVALRLQQQLHNHSTNQIVTIKLQKLIHISRLRLTSSLRTYLLQTLHNFLSSGKILRFKSYLLQKKLSRYASSCIKFSLRPEIWPGAMNFTFIIRFSSPETYAECKNSGKNGTGRPLMKKNSFSPL